MQVVVIWSAPCPLVCFYLQDVFGSSSRPFTAIFKLEVGDETCDTSVHVFTLAEILVVIEKRAHSNWGVWYSKKSLHLSTCQHDGVGDHLLSWDFTHLPDGNASSFATGAVCLHRAPYSLLLHKHLGSACCLPNCGKGCESRASHLPSFGYDSHLNSQHQEGLACPVVQNLLEGFLVQDLQCITLVGVMDAVLVSGNSTALHFLSGNTNVFESMQLEMSQYYVIPQCYSHLQPNTNLTALTLKTYHVE